MTFNISSDTPETRVVRDFFAMFSEDLRGAYVRYFADNVEHTNSGMLAMDKAQTLNSFFSPTADLGFITIRVEILRLGQVGTSVFTERVDHHLDASGNTVLVTPVCGVIDVANGEIVRMAEYFDSQPVKAYFEARTNVTTKVY